MPHRDLARGEALELAEAVFEPELEGVGSIYGELEPEKYLSDFAAVVPASSLPEEAEAESPPLENPDEPVLVESILPLRTKNSSGEEEAVDLELERSEGGLRPGNPLAEVTIPDELGEGVSLTAAEVGITVAGAPEHLAPTDAEGAFAFYPEVAQDTDLVVTPTPQGVETMTDIRSAEAPMQTSYELELPTEAELRTDPEGGAEVVEGGRTTLVIPRPTSIDAAGDPVRTELTVSEQGISVGIEPDPSTSFPVLVDPEYKQEGWEWQSGQQGTGGWSGSSTNPGAMAPLPYEAWNSSVPGLDLTSGFGGTAHSGDHADWDYWVPRYQADLNKYGSAPSTWVGLFYAPQVRFHEYGNTENYPALVLGLIDPSVGWRQTWVHYGGQGDLELLSMDAVENGSNLAEDRNVKGAGMNLVTYQEEQPSKRRDADLGDAFIKVYDEDAPQIVGLTPPSGWVSGASASIGYTFRDTGLGVRSASVGLPGKASLGSGWGADLNCTGAAASPCPREPGSAEAGRPKLGFVPNQLPDGKDKLEVVAKDPFGTAGHTATANTTVKVDDTPPEIGLSGPLVEPTDPRTPPAGAPVAAYSFDEGEGAVAHDATGDGHEGTVEGPLWTGGKFGEALDFGGGPSQQCVTVPDSPELQLAHEFTLEAWVKPEGRDTGDPVIFKELEPGSEYSYAMGIGLTQAGRVEGWAQGEGGAASAYSPETLGEDEWTHIAYSYDGQDMRIFVDGEQVSEKFVGAEEMGSSGALRIGCSGPEFAEQFDGRIDEVRIYDRALDQAEVAADEVEPLGPPSPPHSPVAAYSFDAGEGAIAEDATDHGHDGTITGAQWAGGESGQALKFTRASRQCVTVPDSPELQLTHQFTLEAWVKPEGEPGPDPVVFKEAEPGSGYSYSFGIGFTRAGRVEGWAEGENVYSPEMVEEDEWTHIAYSYDGEDMHIYVDGEEVTDKHVGTGEMASSGPLLIGCSSPDPEYDEQFEGRIDEVQIYDRALDAAEIASHEQVEPAQSEHLLQISATDGSQDEPQSGVSTVEVKVDGKKQALPDEGAWDPHCSTENCAVDRQWTLDPAGFSPGHHEVEVVARDAAGLTSSTTMEVELGGEPLQTSFTTPHPTYEDHEIESIGFKATREGVPVEGATFRCSLDGATARPCNSPFRPSEHLEPEKWHVLTVDASDKAGIADPTPARWTFQTGDYPAAPANEKLVYPEAGRKTASYYTLEAEWGGNPEGKAAEGVSGVSFQMQLPGWETFRPVPEECTIDGREREVSWPLPAAAHPGHSEPVYLKVRGCPVFEEAGYPEKEIRFRAVFDGGDKVAGASEPAATEFVRRHNANAVATDATEEVGPASVDLLTGAFTMSHTDVSIPVPGYEANLEFTRTYNSSIDPEMPGYSWVLGGAWQPSSPLESEGEGEAWTRIEEQVIEYHPAVWGYACWTEREVEVGEEEFEIQEPEVSCPGNVAENCPQQSCEKWLEEEEQPEERWIEIFDNEGASIPFEIVNGKYIAPEYAKEIVLTHQANGNFVLAYPNGTHTTFTPTGQRIWLPALISFQATPNSTRMVYKPEPESEGKVLRLVEEIAPSPVVCEDTESEHQVGCRTLVFNYTEGILCYIGSSYPCVNVLQSIKYYGPSGNPAEGATVAQYTYGAVKGPEGTTERVLAGESDPRLSGLAESYTYEAPPNSLLLTSLKPPGQEPWNFAYETAEGFPRLKSVGRAGVSTTIAYGVPLEGSGAPYDMSAENIATWGQTEIPVDATAIFPPNHVPAEYPPHEYTGATIHYIDPEGYEVNTASPSPPGVSGASIATTETDIHGNVVRELDPQNRLVALAASEPVSRSHKLDTHSVYNATGTELLESWGPLHQVRLESGEAVEAREHTTVRYDEGEPTPQAGTPSAYLPTTETVGAAVPGRAGDLEPRVTVTHYNWGLLLPEEVIVDPSGLNIRSITHYNSAGQVVETRQPKGAAGETAGDTKTVYYSAGGSGECAGSPRYVNLPCRVGPAKQELGSGREELPVTKYLAYNALDEPTEIVESPGGKSSNERKTFATYDAAGRPLIKKFEGGGTVIPKTETFYSRTQGLPERQQQACESNCASYSTSFGTSGTGELKRPLGIAVDASGDVYVAAKELNCVKEFSPAGVFLGAIGKCGTAGSGNGEFKEPRAVAIDPEGHIWVVDTGNLRVEEFTAAGAYIQSLGGGHLTSPYELAVDGEGRVWVSDQSGKIVEYKETSPGVYPFYGEVTSVEGAKVEPEGISVDASGDLWVAEGNADRITELELTSSGYVNHHVFASAGSGPGQLSNPFDVAVGRWGELLVVDAGNDRIQQFSLHGNYMGSFGAEGTEAGQLIEPASITLGPGGAIYVTDRGNKRVEKWQTGSGARATTTTYNGLGQVTGYEDADGNKTTTTYDAYGRPATVTDPRGTETMHYDEASGVLTSMEVSGVGTFTAHYDADGNLIERGLPNGLTVKTSYDQAGEPTSLAYTKTSSCGEGCTWYEESLERSIEGLILTDKSSLVGDHYAYDKDGRLTEVQETPTGGQCTSRAYTFDADSNRLTKTTRSPGVGSTCATSGGTTQKYEYDQADRLIGPTYDAWGRITSLPAEFAGGKALTTSYFSNNMVASQAQSGVTNTFQLDAAGRQRQREQTGGVAGTEVFHYDGSSDSPAWTSLGSTWSRNIPGIGGELAAIQESSGTTTFKLVDLHGDVVASASSSPTATKLLATSRFSEFGEPLSGGAGPFGWLGGKSRRTELASGVIQMGARSYVPQLGRFLTPDPIAQGSANSYDYGDQDPVNTFDLTGTRARKKKKVTHHARVRSVVSRPRVARASTTRSKRPVDGPTKPWPQKPGWPEYEKPPVYAPSHPSKPKPPHHCPPTEAKYTPYSLVNPCAPNEPWEELGPNVEFPWVD